MEKILSFFKKYDAFFSPIFGACFWLIIGELAFYHFDVFYFVEDGYVCTQSEVGILIVGVISGFFIACLWSLAGAVSSCIIKFFSKRKKSFDED